MASVDMCVHDWPGSGCPECKAEAALPASPAPAAGGLEAVRTLVQACYDEMHGPQCNEEPDDEHVASCLDADGKVAPAGRITFGMIRRAVAALASPAATSEPTYDVNCCNCGRIIDTREESEGGDQWGHELSDDRWVCSPECLDAVTDPDAVPAATSAETQGGDGVRCLATGNPVGTDTWQVGRPCRCANCAALAPSTSAATRGLVDAPAIPTCGPLAPMVDSFDDKWLGDGESVHVLPGAGSAATRGEPVAWRYRSDEKAMWNYCEGPHHPRGRGAEIVEALHPAPAVESAPGVKLRRVRHKKRGTTYRVLGLAEAQISNGRVVQRPTSRKDDTGLRCAMQLAEGDRMLVYQSEADGSLWLRCEAEFEDGRFEDIRASLDLATDAEG